LFLIKFEHEYAKSLFCFFQTLICNGFDFINEISAAENSIDRKIPIIDDNISTDSDIDIFKFKQ